MAQWFAGQFLQKVDGKGRVSVPAEFRRVLERGDPEWSSDRNPQFAIIFGDDHPDSPAFLRRDFMECLPIEYYHRIVTWIRDQDESPETEAQRELYSTYSHVATIDESGRIVVSPRLREQFDLDGEARFVATGTTFQIWEPGTHDTYRQTKRKAWQESLPPDFNPTVTDSLLKRRAD